MKPDMLYTPTAYDPKTDQNPVGHENRKITMDIYAKVKYNNPKQLASIINSAFSQVG